jgi:hypothetical protein
MSILHIVFYIKKTTCCEEGTEKVLLIVRVLFTLSVDLCSRRVRFAGGSGEPPFLLYNYSINFKRVGTMSRYFQI